TRAPAGGRTERQRKRARPERRYRRSGALWPPRSFWGFRHGAFCCHGVPVCHGVSVKVIKKYMHHWFTYPNISPIAFRIGPLAVHWYGISYLIGFIAVYLWMSRPEGRRRLGLTRE